jgi:crotonobetainyl-CoA:carnitine CoA-transferase CaiB-like acyl-CoA transferase
LKGYLAGPYENRGALDEVVQMQTGLAYMTGPPGKPLRMGAPIIDILGAVFGIVAVLAALRERERTGRGQRVGSALFESAAFLVGTHMAGSAVTGKPMPPMPARTGAWGVYDVFNTSDQQQVFVAVTSDGHWQRFCEKFGFADLGSDRRLATNAARSAEREWLIPELASRLAGISLRRILEECEAAKVPCARVNRPDDLSADPHLLAGGALLATTLSALGGGPRVGLPALPLEFGDRRERSELARQPPRIGEHGEEVLCEAGFSPAEIQALMARGVLGRQTA